jgi:hypothetical protein
MLIVNVANTNRDLTTLATVKDELGVTDNTIDTKLGRYINQASGMIAEYCNRVFAIETVTETMRNGPRRSYSLSNPWHGQQQSLILQRYPVISIVSLAENDILLDPSAYEVDAANGEIQRLDNSQYSLWSASKITITYSAGFTLPTGLPSGIERACIMLVKQFAASGDRDPMVQSERSDGVGSTQFFNASGTGLPPEVEGLISIHRKQNI